MLPIEALLPDLHQALTDNPTVLLQAPPGAGKTTRVPLSLLASDWRGERKILMLEPRRLAARSAARYMARQLGEQPGQSVGYRTRLDTKVSAQTRIEVVTEGILTRLIQDDPALEAYAAVLFDEFHERSLQADLGLALVRECQQALREDLRVVVMSATLDTAPIARLLGEVPILTSEGRSFPVDILYRPLPRNARLTDQVVTVIREALAEQSGSVLVFLPGAGEIRRVEQALSGNLPAAVAVTPLYGSLRNEDQDRAIAPAPDGQRKVVLATAIAETSLTIEGIRVVVDAGQQRRAVFDPNSGMTRLLTGRVSKASAEQRKGRAGRVEPGVCYRLWSESDQFGLADFTPPEIQQADLAPLVLELAQWGARAAGDLEWIDPPPSAHWQQAVSLLRWLDLLNDDGSISEQGKAARTLPVHPRLAHMVLRGRSWGLGQVAAELAALLEERDLLGPRAGADLFQRWQLLRGETRDGRVDGQRLQALRRAVRRMTEGKSATASTAGAMDLGRLLVQAYPDRIARRRQGNAPRYQLSNGRGAQLRDDDPLAGEDWLVAADLDGQTREAQIYLAAPLDPAMLTSDLAGHIETLDESLWDEGRGRVIARRQTRLGQLVLAEQALPEPGPEQIIAGLLNAVRQKGLKSLPWDAQSRQLRARIQCLHRLWPEAWPALDDHSLLAELETWLAPFLIGVDRWSRLQQVKLAPALTSLLDYHQQQTLAELAPASLTIPTGQAVRLDYLADHGPVLAAKLQALFGWTETPTVARGQVPVVLHLLSPAQRPLAVTSDLASFWRNGYVEVRKDMRGRYPKHPWPEDPFTAEAKQGTKKQRH
ncbi:ATP-dependent helicase HrpB [Marinobacter sp. SS21]|uniref:ATP-dependent helicase HrpB n=1 Tax=Marinobacter sp. SS21 TaxID=2979460 RepID=UPI002330B733|nr:ATP-dependent helicase HrpB [Marinobacter sp. SS21]MDC0661006.1 ATP-dependent helicase HrpB [Marinobacter sp. SS21]